MSLALWRAGFLKEKWSRDSTGLMTFGLPGKGRWFTIYASPAHVFIVFSILGLPAPRFDTSPHDMKYLIGGLAVGRGVAAGAKKATS